MSCDYQLDPCLPDGSYNAQTKYKKEWWLTHTKDINEVFVLGSYEIPLRIRKRNFRLGQTQGWEKETPYLVYDLYGNLDNCAEILTSLWNLSISENAVFTDSTIFIADTEHSNGFWKEDKYTIVFSGSSGDKTYFYAPSFEASKLKITSVNVQVTHTWKMMLNGITETLFSETYSKQIYWAERPLIIVMPVPLTGQTTDPEIIEYGFYDFMVDGIAEMDGGYDFYYAEWLRDFAGTYKDQDKADAKERWEDTQGTGALHEVVKRNVIRPTIHGPEEARGSIIRDYAGNTFASVTVTKSNGDLLHINKLIDSDGNEVVIPETLPGANIRYYPVGLI